MAKGTRKDFQKAPVIVKFNYFSRQKFMIGTAGANASVFIAGLINTVGIVGAGLLPIPLLINLYGPDLYRDYLSFMAFVGLFAFSNLMFPQNFSDLVSKCRLDAFSALIAMVKHNVVFCVFIGICLIPFFGNLDIDLFLSAFIFSLIRSIGFIVSAGFSGYRKEWIDKGMLSPLLHLTPVLAIPLHLFIFPDVNYFGFLNFLVFFLVCFFLGVSISRGYINIGLHGSYSLDISSSVVVFLSFNVTSVTWLAYPLILEAFLPEVEIVGFSVAFKMFAFASSISTPVVLAFWTRLSDFKALPNFQGLYWVVIIFAGLATCFQLIVYENYLNLLDMFGLDKRNMQNSGVLIMLGLFGVCRIFSNIGVVMVARYVNNVSALIVLSVAEFGSWASTVFLYCLGAFSSGEMMLAFGFSLSSLSVLGATVVLVRKEVENRLYS